MNNKRRARPSTTTHRDPGTNPVSAEIGIPVINKPDRLSLILSIVAIVVSALSVLFTAFDFLGSRAVVLFMEPKTDEIPVVPTAAFTLRSASPDVSILRVHVHFLAGRSRVRSICKFSDQDQKLLLSHSSCSERRSLRLAVGANRLETAAWGQFRS